MSYKILDDLDTETNHGWWSDFLNIIASNVKNIFESISLTIPESATGNTEDYGIILKNNDYSIIITPYAMTEGYINLAVTNPDGTELFNYSYYYGTNRRQLDIADGLCIKSSYGLFMGSGDNNTTSGCCLIFAKTNTGEPVVVISTYYDAYVLCPELDIINYDLYNAGSLCKSAQQTTLCPLPLDKSSYVNGVYLSSHYQSSYVQAYLFMLEDTIFAGQDISLRWHWAFRCT